MNATALLRCGKCGARENRAASRHSRRVHSAVETRGPSPGNSTSHEPWVRLGTVPREKDFSKALELEAHKRDTTPNTIFDWSTRVGAKRREQTRDPKRGLSQSIQIGSPVSISRCALKNPADSRSKRVSTSAYGFKRRVFSLSNVSRRNPSSPHARFQSSSEYVSPRRPSHAPLMSLKNAIVSRSASANVSTSPGVL